MTEVEPRHDPIFQPGLIGDMQLANRVLMAPMGKNLCTASGATRYCRC